MIYIELFCFVDNALNSMGVKEYPTAQLSKTALKFMNPVFGRTCRLYADKALNDYKSEEKLSRKKIRLIP